MKPKTNLLALLSITFTNTKAQLSEKGVIHASPCEICKIMSIEMEDSLLNTGKNKEKIEMGRFTVKKTKSNKIVDYQRSELRLIETLEDVCPKLLEYNMHKERKGSLRFGTRGEKSETFKALDGLVDRGVKVDLGIPHDLWDEPSAEITQMKKQCESYIEKFDEDIESWYFDKNHFGKKLADYFCRDIVLKSMGLDDSCLKENWTGVEKVTYDDEEDKEDNLDDESASSKKNKHKKVPVSKILDEAEMTRQIKTNAKDGSLKIEL